MSNSTQTLIDHFSLVEKVLMRLGLGGCTIMGAYVILSANILLGIIYIVLGILGLVVVTRALCTRCPYPYQYSDCLFFPFKWIKKLYKFRPSPPNFWDKLAIIVGMGIIFLIPQYWLFKNKILFIIFWIVAIILLLRISVYLCKHCRNFNCPFNMVSEEMKNE